MMKKAQHTLDCRLTEWDLEQKWVLYQFQVLGLVVLPLRLYDPVDPIY